MGKIADALKKSGSSESKSAHPIQPADTMKPEDPKDSKRHAAVTFDNNMIDRDLIAVVNPNSFEAEAFRQLRSKILFPIKGESPKSILITSALPGEGKTFVSANLAASIANNVDERVLLMDCDLRKPELHSRCGFGEIEGLSNFLANGAPVSSLIVDTAVKKLGLLPAGKITENPTEMLTSEKMLGFLKELKYTEKWDYVVIDSPPPIFGSEAFAMSKYVDAILVVIGYASTSKNLVKDLVSNFDQEKIIGAVINKSDLKKKSYGRYYKRYGRYYQSYRKQSKEKNN